MKKQVKGGKTVSIPVRSTSESRTTSGFHHFTNKSGRESGRIDVKEFEAYRAKKMTYPKYKPAVLYSANGNINIHWYVYYYYLIPGETTKYKKFKELFGINRIKDLKERLAYGKELVKFINEKLEAGFNPFEAVKLSGGVVETKILAQLFALKTELSHGASEYSISTFTEHYNRIAKYITEKDLKGLSVASFTGKEAERYKNWLNDNKFARKTINATFSYLGRFWDLAIKKNWAKENPFKFIPRVTKREESRETENERFEPITSTEMDIIFGSLKETGETMFINYLAVIFYAWVRPIEITRLKISDIDFNRDAIRFRKSETKNNTAAFVQLVPPLKAMLEKMNLRQFPADMYLFSKDGFNPGYEKMDKHFAGKKWRNLVKEKLRINKDMYALKHTGNIEYLLNNKGNIDLKWQQKQNRHSSSAMTEQYNRKLGVYFIEVNDLNFRHFE